MNSAERRHWSRLKTREEKLETALRLALLWIPLPEMIERAEPKAQVQAIWDEARDLELLEEGS